jgi:hypothetical protein
VELVLILFLLAFLVLLTWGVYSFITSPGQVFTTNKAGNQSFHLPSEVKSGFAEEAFNDRETGVELKKRKLQAGPEPDNFAWGNLWKRKLAEEAKVQSLIRQGLPIEYDRMLLSEAWVKQLIAKAKEAEVGNEIGRIRKAFLENLELEQSSDILSAERVATLKQEVFQELRSSELERLKRRLELGLYFDGDLRLVSVQDWKDLKSEFDDVRNVWLRNRRRPSPQPYGVSSFGAEQLVADWLLFLGCKNVHVTQPSQDDGIDVFADDYVCQVKNYSTQLVSVNEVREIYGVSAMVGKRAMLFASTGLTASAAKFAEEAYIPAIKFVVETSELVPLNAEAEKFLDEGMYEFPE